MNIWILAKAKKIDTYENMRLREVAAEMDINITMQQFPSIKDVCYLIDGKEFTEWDS